MLDIDENNSVTISEEVRNRKNTTKRLTNYAERSKQLSKIVLAGELIVLKYEEKKLKEHNIKKVSEHTRTSFFCS